MEAANFSPSSDQGFRQGVGCEWGVLLPLRPGGSGGGALKLAVVDSGGSLRGLSHMNSMNGHELVVGVLAVGLWPCARRSFGPLPLWGNLPAGDYVSVCGLGEGVGGGDSKSLVLTLQVHTHHLQHSEEGECAARRHGAAAVETWQEAEAWRLVQPGGCVCTGQVGMATSCRLLMWVRGAVPRLGQQQRRGSSGLTRFSY